MGKPKPPLPADRSPWSNLRVITDADAEAWAAGWSETHGRETWAWFARSWPGPGQPENRLACSLFLVGDRVVMEDLRRRIALTIQLLWLGPAGKLVAPVESLVRAGCFEAVEAWVIASRAVPA